MRTPWWTEKFHKDIFGVPQYPESIVDDHLRSIVEERERTGKNFVLSNVPLFKETGEFNDRAKLAFAGHQHGRFLELLGPERDVNPGKRRIFPEDRIEDGKALPPLAIIQGMNDTVTPLYNCDKFVQHLRRHKAVDGLAQAEKEENVFLYVKVPGEHLFENDLSLDESPGSWLKEVTEFIEGYWLEGRLATS